MAKRKKLNKRVVVLLSVMGGILAVGVLAAVSARLPKDPTALAAKAEEGYRFVEWTGDVDKISDVGAAITTITMYDNYEITANFEEDSPFPSPTGGVLHCHRSLRNSDR